MADWQARGRRSVNGNDLHSAGQPGYVDDVVAVASTMATRVERLPLNPKPLRKKDDANKRLRPTQPNTHSSQKAQIQGAQDPLMSLNESIY